MPAPTSPFDLTGRVAVVTGGNRGIGRAIALGLARAGASVGILARNEEKTAQVIEELRAVGVRSMALRLDVTKRSTLEPAIIEVERRLGDVDILVNNARTPTHRWGKADETAGAAVFLASQAADFITGVTLPVDGGYSIS